MAPAVVRRSADGLAPTLPWPATAALGVAAERALAGPRAAFWIAQMGGWAAYGLSTYLTLLASLPASERWAYLIAKLLRAAVGCGASLLLRELYRSLRRRHSPPLVVTTAALVGCTALGAVWLVIYRVGIAPALLTTPPSWGWEIFPRAALDLTFVLATWSGIYFGVLQWQAIQDQTRRTLEQRRSPARPSLARSGRARASTGETRRAR